MISKPPIRYLLTLTLFLSLMSFVSPVEDIYTEQYELSVSLDGEDFNSISADIYSQFQLSEDKLALEVFRKSLKGFMYLKLMGELENDRFLTVLDYSKSSKEKRLWVFDLDHKQVLFNELVAHGKNSGSEYARYFSNRFESRKSSLGFFVTGPIYNGRHRLSMKLRGMEYGFNHNAFARGIVFHGAHYVNESLVYEDQRIGRSFGCPAVSQEVNRSLVEILSDGTCAFFYYPHEDYLNRSKILNADIYIPIDELRRLKD